MWSRFLKPRTLHPPISLILLMDLLFGLGEGKYFGRYRIRKEKTRIKLRGFCASSYAGLAMIHILREIRCLSTDSMLGTIACPPGLLSLQPTNRHKVHLIHYVPMCPIDCVDRTIVGNCLIRSIVNTPLFRAIPRGMTNTSGNRSDTGFD